MSDKEPYELTAASAFVGTELFHIVQGGNSRKGTPNQMLAFVKANSLESFDVALSDESTAITTGTKLTRRMPYAFRCTSVRINVNTVSSSGLVTVNIKKNGTSIFGTKVTIDASEKTSITAATPFVFTGAGPPAYIDFADDDEVTYDIDGAGTGAKGLKCSLLGYKL